MMDLRKNMSSKLSISPMGSFAGAYVLGEELLANGTRVFALSIAMRRKPNFIKRFFMEHLLGLKWRST
jgi:hypothetical protein